MNEVRAGGPNIEVDAVMASVIQGAVENIAVELGYKLMRMSYSSNTDTDTDKKTLLT